MDAFDLIAFILLGFVSGFFGGLFGVGGGSITVPILFFLLGYLGLPNRELMHIVVGTTFAAMMCNAIAALYFHHIHQNVQWKIVFNMLPSLVLGPILGSMIATSLNEQILRYCFGCFQCLTAIYFFWPYHRQQEPHDRHPHPLVLNSIAIVIGAVGSILGIGGGILMVPLLTILRVSMRKAIGTSAATSFVMISMSAISFFILGLKAPVQIPYCIGYVYLPAFIAIGISSTISAPLGVKFMKILPIPPLKKAFAAVLATLGILMILHN